MASLHLRRSLTSVDCRCRTLRLLSTTSSRSSWVVRAHAFHPTPALSRLTQSALSFLITCPNYRNLPLRTTSTIDSISPTSSDHIRLAVPDRHTTHPPDHTHLSPFQLGNTCMVFPQYPYPRGIHQTASNVRRVDFTFHLPGGRSRC